jgi:hypothetical protein
MTQAGFGFSSVNERMRGSSTEDRRRPAGWMAIIALARSDEGASVPPPEKLLRRGERQRREGSLRAVLRRTSCKRTREAFASSVIASVIALAQDENRRE